MIDDPRGAQFLSDPVRRLYFGPFLHQELTLTEFAQVFGLPVNRAHYWLKKMRQFGLITEARRTARRGRASVVYRARAATLFVPFAATPAATLEEHMLQENAPLLTRLIKAMAAGHPAEGIQGTLISAAPDAPHGVRTQTLPALPQGTVNAWLARPLSRDKAAELADELRALLHRYSALEAPEQGGDPTYLLHLGFTEMPRRQATDHRPTDRAHHHDAQSEQPPGRPSSGSPGTDF